MHLILDLSTIKVKEELMVPFRGVTITTKCPSKCTVIPHWHKQRRDSCETKNTRERRGDTIYRRAFRREVLTFREPTLVELVREGLLATQSKTASLVCSNIVLVHLVSIHKRQQRAWEKANTAAAWASWQHPDLLIRQGFPATRLRCA